MGGRVPEARPVWHSSVCFQCSFSSSMQSKKCSFTEGLGEDDGEEEKKRRFRREEQENKKVKRRRRYTALIFHDNNSPTSSLNADGGWRGWQEGLQTLQNLSILEKKFSVE